MRFNFKAQTQLMLCCAKSNPGEAWDSLNEMVFVYKISRLNAVVSNTPVAPTASGQTSFYKDNTKWQGFAEPYGMNIATDDRATLHGRLMNARLADGGKGDQPFLERLDTDKFFKVKAARMSEFFQMLKRDLAISPSSPLHERLQECIPSGQHPLKDVDCRSGTLGTGR